VALRVFLQTFGCRANQYDSEAVAAMVRADGGELVDHAEDADVAVFNSCAVTAAAEADLRQHVRRTARRSATVRTVVMGCAAARSEGEIRALPTVSDVVPGADLDAIAHAIGLSPAARRSAGVTQRGTRGLLRIQDGCDEHCTFCATTLARGRNRSRSLRELVTEAQQLATSHSEIVLTGIHIGTFGVDTGSSLSVLLAALVDEVPIVRFRLSSVEATEVDERLAELLTAAPSRVAPYLHAPLQSGSDAVLRRMGRHWYTTRAYAAAVDAIVSRTSVFGLGADLISGFPGETDADHAATCAFVQSLPFSALHVFPYSPRPGTAAIRLPHAVPDALRRDRAAELRAIGDACTMAYAAQRVGGSADVIVIGKDDGTRDGLTEDYLSVAFAAVAPPRGARVHATLMAGPDARRLVANPIA
jgi:threonylcarbamoyladenosine tRNA methylthiotransferase MtaB